MVNTKPKTLLTKEELAQEDMLNHLYLLKSQLQTNPDLDEQNALIKLTGHDLYLQPQTIEESIVSIQLFGLCPDCGYIQDEDGCPHCNSYNNTVDS